MKKTLLFISLLILSVLSTQATRPKYVFYIIGDGMGINQVNGTEMFYGELTGKIGPLPLLFSKFPYTTFVSTYSANRQQQVRHWPAVKRPTTIRSVWMQTVYLYIV